MKAFATKLTLFVTAKQSLKCCFSQLFLLRLYTHIFFTWVLRTNPHASACSTGNMLQSTLLLGYDRPLRKLFLDSECQAYEIEPCLRRCNNHVGVSGEILRSIVLATFIPTQHHDITHTYTTCAVAYRVLALVQLRFALHGLAKHFSTWHIVALI